MAAQNTIQSLLEKELYYAVINRNSSTVRELVNLCDGTFRDNKGNTLLHYYFNSRNNEDVN